MLLQVPSHPGRACPGARAATHQLLCCCRSTPIRVAPAPVLGPPPVSPALSTRASLTSAVQAYIAAATQQYTGTSRLSDDQGQLQTPGTHK